MNSVFRTICESKGIRVTTVRNSLFDLLSKSSPITVADFFDLSKSNGFDTVSVYRTLDLFRKLDVMDEFGIGRQRVLQARTEIDAHHHFIRCKICGLQSEFEDDAIEYQLGTVAAENGFPKIRSHYLEIIGICQNCSDIPTS